MSTTRTTFRNGGRWLLAAAADRADAVVRAPRAGLG
jgi:hypothetical protein